VGGFAPLTGFLSQADYEMVLSHNRLLNGQLWPIPITLDVSEEFAEIIVIGDEISLCDADNTVLAYMKITDKWKPNKTIEAQAVFGTEEILHPGVNYLLHRTGPWYLGGPIEFIQLPKHYDFVELRYTPETLKHHFSQLNCKNIVGFQTRNPIHRAHMELTLRAGEENDAHILIHPVVGLTKPGDIDYFTRVRCYQKILHYYPSQKVSLSLLPLAMRMGGPKEALWHAIIRKNYGCTHFIVGRDHAGPGNNSQGKPFYDPYESQNLVQEHQDEIGIKMVPFQEMVYVKEKKLYRPVNELKPE
jgi:sulfate adenylyltransferase